MRVVFFSHSAGLNGAERSLLDLVLGIRIYGVKPTVVLPEYGPLVEELERNTIDYIVHPYRFWLGRDYKVAKGVCRWMINRASVPGLAKTISRGGVDLIYSNTLATPVGAMVAKYLDVKHVWHIREFVHEDMGVDFDFGIHQATHYIAKNSSYVIYNSCAVKEKFMPFLGDTPGTVIYNGWLSGKLFFQTEKGILPPEKRIKICMVGSISRGKGQHMAIEALSILKRKFSHVGLNIVGTGDTSYMRELNELCSELHVSSYVTWSGFMKDVSEVYRQSDIALVCSRKEAFGRVVVEAMAEGCAVVASRSGGIPEIIKHGENGLMYKCGCVEDLTRQVSILINDPALYSRIVREGIEDVYKRFSRKRYVEQVHHVLESL